MSLKKIIIIFLVIFTTASVGLLLNFISPKAIEAQCVPYIPMIFQDNDPEITRTGALGSGCHAQTFNVSFGATGVLAQPPLIALQGFDLRFTNGDHHFGTGVIRLISVGLFLDSSVQIGVQACLQDQNTDDSIAYQYWYALAGWYI